MPNFITENPVTKARYQAQQAQRAEDQNDRQEQQAFRDRYAHEVAVNQDRAVRSALSQFYAGKEGPASTTEQQPSQAQGQGQTRSIEAGTGSTAPQGSNNRTWARTPGYNPGGGGDFNQTLIRNLTNTEGSGALALKRFTADEQRQKEHQDVLEDRAWNFLANAQTPEDMEMANQVFRQATGRDMPPAWRTQQASLQAATVDAAARERYPRDVAKRRQFIQVGMTQGLDTALAKMPGEANIGSGANVPQPSRDIVDARILAKAVAVAEGRDHSTEADFLNAYDRVRAKATNNFERMKLIASLSKEIMQNDMLGEVTAEEATAQATDIIDSIAGTQTPSYGGNVNPPQGQDVSGDVPLAPQDPQQRILGKIYRAPDGRLARWVGEGWKLVEPQAGMTGAEQTIRQTPGLSGGH